MASNGLGAGVHESLCMLATPLTNQLAGISASGVTTIVAWVF